MVKRMVEMLIASGLISILACAPAMGPLFKESMVVTQSGKAIVYIYRNNKTGRMGDLDLEVNKRYVLPLPNEGYHLLLLEPGSHYFALLDWSVVRADINIALNANEVYFIKYSTIVESATDITISESIGWLLGAGRPLRHHREFKILERSEALPEIQKCRLIETPVVVNGIIQLLKSEKP